MSETILAQEPMIRMSVFAGILILMAPWEVLSPKRRIEISRMIR